MKSVIREIFYGKRSPFDTVKPSEEYSQLHDEITQLYKLIEKELSDEKKTELKKLCDLQCDAESEATESYYIEGVKLGILLGLEAGN